MLSADEARSLDRLVLGTATAAPVATAAGGQRRVRARGFGQEFQDFRHYQPGDDPRSIDSWSYGCFARRVSCTCISSST
jgi:uncharacterized protein (DUF58 family)